MRKINTIVEYCDNVNCRLNNEFRCESDIVSFDRNAQCLTADYEEEENTHQEEQKTSPEKPPAEESGKNNDWIKYI
jgi:hypothetical protein